VNGNGNSKISNSVGLNIMNAQIQTKFTDLPANQLPSSYVNINILVKYPKDPVYKMKFYVFDASLQCPIFCQEIPKSFKMQKKLFLSF